MLAERDVLIAERDSVSAVKIELVRRKQRAGDDVHTTEAMDVDTDDRIGGAGLRETSPAATEVG